MAFNPIALSFVPMQENSVTLNVNPRQFDPDNWRFQVDRYPTGPEWANDPAYQSAASFYTAREGWQSVKNGMYDNVEAGKPIYGHRGDYLNPLDQEQTNNMVTQQSKTTRIQDVMGFNKLMNPPDRYPVRKNYLNFEGSAYSNSIRNQVNINPYGMRGRRTTTISGNN